MTEISVVPGGGVPKDDRIIRKVDVATSAIVEEVLTYRTCSCSKAKPYWKPNWDFPLQHGQNKEDVNCIYQEGKSILDILFPLVSTRKRNWLCTKV